MDLKIFNTLGKKPTPFRSLTPKKVFIYTCGPTVYRYAHIGNLRTYLLSDIIVRTLRLLGYEVYHVKNITDVGHMTQEMLDRGEDKVIAAARASGKTPEMIARFFTEAYLRDEKLMNFIPADLYPKASEHVEDMIRLVSELVRGGFTYEVAGTIYFDVGKFEEYGRLSGNIPGDLRGGHRSVADGRKKSPEDFILWRKAEPGRDLTWDSPWGEGYPGWHIECTAMAMKYLGNDFDIHVGGIDLVFPHHENEIAQARCARGAGFSRYWIHGGHLLVDGRKMSKSAGNEYTLEDLGGMGFSPLDFRYYCLNASYRTVLNYTTQAQKSSKMALSRLKAKALDLTAKFGMGDEHPDTMGSLDREFIEALCDDLNMPRALSTVWKMVRTGKDEGWKCHLLKRWDSILGLGLFREERGESTVDERDRSTIEELARERLSARKNKDYLKADEIRARIEKSGYSIVDTEDGYRLERIMK